MCAPAGTFMCVHSGQENLCIVELARAQLKFWVCSDTRVEEKLLMFVSRWETDPQSRISARQVTRDMVVHRSPLFPLQVESPGAQVGWACGPPRPKVVDSRRSTTFRGVLKRTVAWLLL